MAVLEKHCKSQNIGHKYENLQITKPVQSFGKTPGIFQSSCPGPEPDYILLTSDFGQAPDVPDITVSKYLQALTMAQTRNDFVPFVPLCQQCFTRKASVNHGIKALVCGYADLEHVRDVQISGPQPMPIQRVVNSWANWIVPLIEKCS